MRLYRFNDRYETQRKSILYKLSSIDTPLNPPAGFKSLSGLLTMID